MNKNQHNKKKSKKYRLDTAANLYPAIRGRKRPGVFRISAALAESVQPDLLQQALDMTLERIPGFSAMLRSGFFWHFFKHSIGHLPIQKGLSKICTHFSPNQNNGFLIRVMVQDYQIALEVFHSVSDGAGAMVFLKTLIAQYLILLGYSIPPTEGILDCNDSTDPSESEDCFHIFAGNNNTRSLPKVRAYKLKGTLIQPYNLKTITGTIPIEPLRSETSKYGVSITEYISAAYLFILNNIQLSEDPHRLSPIKIQVPVNLRNFHETKTLRNFSAFITPEIDPAKDEFTFEEVLNSVHHFIRREVTEKRLREQVASNVRQVNNPLVRLIPLFIKNRIIHFVYKSIGPISFTSTISNLGNVDIPAEMAAHVKSFGLTLGATQDTNVSCGMLGYNGNLYISFSRVIEEEIVEQKFFSFLRKRGIPIAVGGNT